MVENDKKTEEIISVLNDYGFKMNFRIGADELIYHKDNYNGYVIFNMIDNTLSFISVSNKIEKIDNSIKNITDNKETLIELLKTI